MALTINPATKVISVPQADLTLVSGTLYEMDTNQFKKDVGKLLDDEDYIWMADAFIHNTEVTVAGTTFARTIEFINGYSIEFTPDSQWSVRLAGSNNNIFDVENGILVQNQVQVIPTNSGGLISGAALADDVSTLTSTVTTLEIIMRNKSVTDPVTGIQTWYDTDGTTPLLTAQLYEGTGTGQTYRGQGAERRERAT